MERREYAAGLAEVIRAALPSVPRIAGITTLTLASVFLSYADAQTGKDKKETVQKKEVIDDKLVAGMERLLYKAWIKDPSGPDTLIWSQTLLKEGAPAIRLLLEPPLADGRYKAFCRQIAMREVRARPEHVPVLIDGLCDSASPEWFAGALAEAGEPVLRHVHELFTGAYRPVAGKEPSADRKAFGSRRAVKAWEAIISERALVPDPKKKGEFTETFAFPDDKILPRLIPILKDPSSASGQLSALDREHARKDAATLLTQRLSFLPHLCDAIGKDDAVAVAAVTALLRSMPESADRGTFLSLTDPDPILRLYRQILAVAKEHPAAREQAVVAEKLLQDEVESREQRLKKLKGESK